VGVGQLRATRRDHDVAHQRNRRAEADCRALDRRDDRLRHPQEGPQEPLAGVDGFPSGVGVIMSGLHQRKVASGGERLSGRSQDYRAGLIILAELFQRRRELNL
jgi:hypothetical protein